LKEEDLENGQPEQRDGRKSWTVMVAEYSALAFLLPACTVVGYIAGALLDRAFGTSFLTIVFLLLGIAGGFVELIRKVSKDPGNI
jgi:F0F1-type ATP synthase assembly protein I